MHIIAIRRGERTDPLPGPREEDTIPNVAPWLALLQHFVESDHIGIIGWEIVLEMLEKIILVERTDHAGAGLAVEAPLFQVVPIGVLPFPPHLNEREHILKHFMMAGERAVRFLFGESDVQLMSLHVFCL